MSEAAEPAVGDAKVAAPPNALPGVRQLTDPKDMRALSHPIRLALLEVLLVYGSLTATQAGELIGESPSSCSFHLRTLARHHFVEETGEGRGRERPWRLVTIGMNIPELPVGSEGYTAAAALAQLAAERQIGRLRQWWARRRNVEQVWLDATAQSDFTTWLTPAELKEVNDGVLEVLTRYHGRLGDPSLRPPGAKLVEMLYFSYLSSVGQREVDVPPDEPPSVS
jgi:DNA-binding transcriptional ArsR family regulator